MSSEVSRSCGTSFSAVRKKTSSPLSLASRKADSSGDVPEEIRPTQPPVAVLYVEEPVVQESFGGGSETLFAGSYSYTSSWLLTSCGTSASLELKNRRPLLERYRD